MSSRTQWPDWDLYELLYPEGLPPIIEQPKTEGRAVIGPYPPGTEPTTGDLHTSSRGRKVLPPSTEQELEMVQKQIDQPRETTPGFRVEGRDAYLPENPEIDAMFEEAASSRDPIAAYKKLFEQGLMEQEELDSIIEAYSGS